MPFPVLDSDIVALCNLHRKNPVYFFQCVCYHRHCAILSRWIRIDHIFFKKRNNLVSDGTNQNRTDVSANQRSLKKVMFEEFRCSDVDFLFHLPFHNFYKTTENLQERQTEKQFWILTKTTVNTRSAVWSCVYLRKIKQNYDLLKTKNYQ